MVQVKYAVVVHIIIVLVLKIIYCSLKHNKSNIITAVHAIYINCMLFAECTCMLACTNIIYRSS